MTLLSKQTCYSVVLVVVVVVVVAMAMAMAEISERCSMDQVRSSMNCTYTQNNLNIRVFNNIYVDRILLCCLNIHRRRFVWDVLCILFEERPLTKVHGVEPKLLRIHQLTDRS